MQDWLTLASQAGQNLINAGMNVGTNAQNIFNMANPAIQCKQQICMQTIHF